MNDASTYTVDSRSLWRLALRLFLAATVVAWLLLCFQVRGGLGPTGWIYAYFSLLTFHTSLLGFWVGFGRWRWRIPVAAATGSLLGVVSDFAFGTNSVWEFQVYTMGIFFIVAVTTFALRLGKGSLRLMSEADYGQANVLQFSIRRIMVWTAAIAILHAVGRVAIEVIGRYGGGWITTNDLAMIGSLAFFVSIVTVANVWALLQMQISTARVVILLLAILAAAMMLYALYAGGVLFAVTAVASQLLMGIVILMLRKQGLRFMQGNMKPAESR